MDAARILRLRTDGPLNHSIFRLFTEKTSLWCSDILDLVPAISIAGDERHFPDLAPSQKLGFLVNENYKIYRLRDQRLLRSICGFSHEAFQADQSAEGVVRVHSRRAARVPRVPGLQHRVGLRTADLTDNDAGRLQPHTRSEAIQHGHISDCQEIDVVSHRALELGR